VDFELIPQELAFEHRLGRGCEQHVLLQALKKSQTQLWMQRQNKLIHTADQINLLSTIEL
jgi:hypothetical protein